MISSDKPRALASRAEEEKIGRAITTWVNTYPNLPDGLYKGAVLYELLNDSAPAMALSTIQGTYITARYITGGHQAEYQYKIIYRIKPGDSTDKRLKADELLDGLGDWASTNLPDLGEGIRVIRNEATTRSAVFAAYEGGDEDHQILMRLTYEVI